MSDLIFGTLPPNIFKPLASKNRKIYISLLQGLYEEFFGDIMILETPRQTDVVAFIRRFQSDLVLGDDDDMAGSGPENSDDATDPAYTYFNRLVETGWLKVHRDGYLQVVEMPPPAALLLRNLLSMENQLTTRYSNTTISILGSIQTARAYPDQNAAGILAAEELALGFVAHLRAMISGLRDIEDRMRSVANPDMILETFFDLFVREMFIADYRTLKTSNNPFRHRHDIVTQCAAIHLEEQQIDRLGRCIFKEGRVQTVADGIHEIHRAAESIQRVFQRIDDMMDMIDDFRMRLEKRLLLTIEYMGHTRSTPVGTLQDVTRRLADVTAPLDAHTEIEPAPGDLPAPLTIRALQPRGISSLHNAPPERSRPKPKPKRRKTEDPEDRAFRLAKRAFQERLFQTPAKLNARLDELFADGRDVILSSEMPLETLDDFLVFDAVRRRRFQSGSHAIDYILEERDGYHDNDWIKCQAFSLMKREKSHD